ncbi:hypothetical protein [Novosphingobium olei]|uniref:hypothetical protein n=1 Tax=Novosphingobium olei TaxID=2728851 RepID=UPI00308ECAE5|nr:hypothetical protein NSDW_07830 [Novosphingobium olei]
MKKIVLAALVPAALLSAAAPASAQAWGHRDDAARYTPVRNDDVRRDIDGLRFQIDRAERNRAISRREADGLRRQARDIQRQYAYMSRGGLDRGEYRTLQRRVAEVRGHLRMERWDRDGRRG